MKKIFILLLLNVLICHSAASLEESDLSAEDLEIIEYLDLLENLDFLEENQGLLENYEEIGETDEN